MATKDMKEYWKKNSKARRQKMIDEHGIDYVRKLEAEKKRLQRAKKKTEKEQALLAAEEKEPCDVKELSTTPLKGDKSVPIKESTLAQYMAKVNRVYKQLYKTEPTDCNDYEWLKDTNKIIFHVIKKYGIENNTSLGYLTALTSVTGRLDGFKETHAKFSDAMLTLLKKSKQDQGENQLTEKELKNYVPWNEILNTPERDDPIENLIFTLYTSLPPRRSQDYQLMKIMFGTNINIDDLDSNYNYLLPDMGKIVFKRFKTDKTYGTQIVSLKSKDTEYIKYSKVRKAMKELLKAYTYSTGDYLFPASGGDYQRNFTQVVQKIFTIGSKRPTVNLLRHAFITYFMNDGTHSSNEIEKMAALLSHSVETMLRYRKHS